MQVEEAKRASMTKEQLRASGKKQRPSDANPVWFKPIMFGFLLLGFVWIIVYYLSQGYFPVQALGDWNILVGFGIALVGFLMMTNWK
nr:cell division protein CrgA [Gulosibacter chungangensis]